MEFRTFQPQKWTRKTQNKALEVARREKLSLRTKMAEDVQNQPNPIPVVLTESDEEFRAKAGWFEEVT